MIKEEILKLNYKDFGYNKKTKFNHKIRSYLECKSDFEFLDKAEWDGVNGNQEFLSTAYKLLGLDFTKVINEYNSYNAELKRLEPFYLSAISSYKIKSFMDAMGYSNAAKVWLDKKEFMFKNEQETKELLSKFAKEHYKSVNGEIYKTKIIEYYGRVGKGVYKIYL